MEREYTGVYSADCRGLQPDFLKRVQASDWQPMGKMPYNAYGDQALRTAPPRRGQYRGTYTATCPECGITFTAERSLGGKRTYHTECAEIVRMRRQRESKAKSAAKMKGG